MESINGRPQSSTLPEEWLSRCDWDSHRNLLYRAIKNTNGTVVELGCGDGSTELIAVECEKEMRKFVSLDSNIEWVKKFPRTQYVSTDYSEAKIFMPCGLLFIDNAPGELRKELIRDYSHSADVIIAHDSESGAEYVYGMANVLSTFKFRLDYKPEDKPATTAVSNFIDVSKWIIPE